MPRSAPSLKYRFRPLSIAHGYCRPGIRNPLIAQAFPSMAATRRKTHGTAHRIQRARKGRYWSAAVTESSDALDLEPKVFEKEKPAEIARSLKRSAEASHRRKSSPYRSAMSMLTFYINRAGKNLTKRRLTILEQAKTELRKAFGRA